MTREEKFMLEAIQESRKGMENNEGGPFGCIIVKDNKIVGRGNNQVTSSFDPTAHAEVVAIRNACKNLNTFQLTDCEIYTSCEPCPMCLGALYWARPKVIYFANTKDDAAAIGFDDSLIYQQINVPLENRLIPMKKMALPEAISVFQSWHTKNDKVKY